MKNERSPGPESNPELPSIPELYQAETVEEVLGALRDRSDFRLTPAAFRLETYQGDDLSSDQVDFNLSNIRLLLFRSNPEHNQQLARIARKNMSHFRLEELKSQFGLARVPRGVRPLDSLFNSEESKLFSWSDIAQQAGYRIHELVEEAGVEPEAIGLSHLVYSPEGWVDLSPATPLHERQDSCESCLHGLAQQFSENLHEEYPYLEEQTKRRIGENFLLGLEG